MNDLTYLAFAIVGYSLGLVLVWKLAGIGRTQNKENK